MGSRLGKKNKVRKTPILILKESGCFESLTSQPLQSYVGIINGKRTYIRRYIRILEEKLERKLLPKECACHTCDNRLCVNANHLFVGTQKDNMRDAQAKGRLKTPFTKGHSIKWRNGKCPKGHDITNKLNVITKKNGSRRCRRCEKPNE